MMSLKGILGKPIAAVFLLPLLSAILACAPTGTHQESPSEKPLVWGGPRNISMLPIIADKKGFFKEVGLNIETNYVQTGKIAMDAIVSGDLDFGVIVDTNIAFVEFQEGADIRVIASIIEKYDDAIIARRDAGIEKPQDLEGKSLAILTGTTSHRFADLFIDFYGLDRKKIEFINLSPPGIQAGLLNGTIPAGSIWQPFRYNVEKELGDGVVQFNDRRIYTAYSLVGVRQRLLVERPEDVRKFLRALILAEEFVSNNTDEAIAILAGELNIEPNVLKAIWEEYTLTVKLDMKLRQVFLEEGQWIEQGQEGFKGRTIPTYEHVLEPSFLRDVAAERVIADED